MRIEQLEYLAAVTRHGSLRRASERLHLSQPALSEALSKLERELGVTLLDRRRSGARISRQGQELLPTMVEVLEAVDRLRQAAGDPTLSLRMLRVGTVNAGTSAVLVPAMHAFRTHHPGTLVEMVSTRPQEIHEGLVEGGLDLGLVNVLPGDDVPPDLQSMELLHGRPVVCCRTDHPFAQLDAVEPEQLAEEPFVAMRSGYLMHRYAHRLFGGTLPATSFSTDGAEMGKLMVADGLGVTILPDYSIDEDPIVQSGMLTHRPIAGDTTRVTLLLVHRRVAQLPPALRGLRDALLDRARAHAQSA
jgi:DNA-binding transcriptional LysR family regulator